MTRLQPVAKRTVTLDTYAKQNTKTESESESEPEPGPRLGGERGRGREQGVPALRFNQVKFSAEMFKEHAFSCSQYIKSSYALIVVINYL